MKITDTHVYFYQDTFSNWCRKHNLFRDPLNGNIPFDTTEQAFMWWKAVFFQDSRIATLLENTTAPGHCKSLGRQIQNYDDASWYTVRFGFMTYVNLLKYRQNPDMAKELKETGSRIIVEASVEDKIWGVGLDENDPLILDDKNWQGTNLLGKALMEVRGLI